jgi:photosynthetic reaction center cytochrome c subunit
MTRTRISLVCIPLVCISLAAQPARAQAPAAKTAEQVFKNITALKGTPADQLNPSMQFIAASLGVQCTFCHVQGKMDADDNPHKKTARAMIAMTMQINKDSFGGRQQMTCYSCHRGAAHPVGIPPVLGAGTALPRPAAPPVAAASELTVDQIIEKHVTAIGGAEAMQKITTRVMKGAIAVGGIETPIDVITKAPNKRISITHVATGDSSTAFDGKAGWMGNAGRPTREMTVAESGASGLDAEFYFALRIKSLFDQIRRGSPETVNGFDCETLIASGPGYPSARLYFDKSSGLLLRMVRYADTPLGRNATQIDYSDYREFDGVKTPFKWTLARPNGRFTIQIAEVKNNGPVEDSVFARPVPKP